MPEQSFTAPYQICTTMLKALSMGVQLSTIIFTFLFSFLDDVPPLATSSGAPVTGM